VLVLVVIAIAFVDIVIKIACRRQIVKGDSLLIVRRTRRLHQTAPQVIISPMLCLAAVMANEAVARRLRVKDEGWQRLPPPRLPRVEETKTQEEEETPETPTANVGEGDAQERKTRVGTHYGEYCQASFEP
jgi:hypothetical protein